MNNKLIQQSNKIILASIFLALMALGIISAQSVSALTNAERFKAGVSYAIGIAHTYYDQTKPNIDYEKKTALGVLGSPDFNTKHTDAYRNGFISGIDHAFGYKLPYTNYIPTFEINDNNDPSQPIYTYYHQNTSNQ